MDELIQLLIKALSDEYQAALQYIVHANQLRGLYRDPIADHLKEHADDEIAHADRLTIHLYSHGVDVTVEMPQFSIPSDTVGMLSQDLQDEGEAIDIYSQIVALCEDNEALMDTKMLIEDILVDEVEHQDEVAALLRAKASGGGLTGGQRQAAASALLRTAEVLDDREMVDEADKAVRLAGELLETV